MRTVRYYLVAVVVSVLWWPLLQVAPSMFKILSRRVLEVSVREQLLLFCVTGVIIAAAFKRLIVGADGRRNIVLGATLPFVAAEVFAIVLAVYQTARGVRDVWTGLIWAPAMAFGAVYVVVPLGIGAQYIMRWAGRDSGAAHATAVEQTRRQVHRS